VHPTNLAYLETIVAIFNAGESHTKLHNLAKERKSLPEKGFRKTI
jgi:hypothetical protein